MAGSVATDKALSAASDGCGAVARWPALAACSPHRPILAAPGPMAASMLSSKRQPARRRFHRARRPSAPGPRRRTAAGISSLPRIRLLATLVPGRRRRLHHLSRQLIEPMIRRAPHSGAGVVRRRRQVVQRSKRPSARLLPLQALCITFKRQQAEFLQNQVASVVGHGHGFRSLRFAGGSVKVIPPPQPSPGGEREIFTFTLHPSLSGSVPLGRHLRGRDRLVVIAAHAVRGIQCPHTAHAQPGWAGHTSRKMVSLTARATRMKWCSKIREQRAASPLRYQG
jgi:hypothetical protein